MARAPWHWQTETPHADNAATMTDYLENEMDPSWVVERVEGSYAEVMTDCGEMLALHAAGHGDAFNHQITFEAL